MSRCCWECKKLSYESGVEGFDYSEVTPGPSTAQPMLKCTEGHWEVDFLSDSEHEFRIKIMTATKCDDFVQFEAARGRRR